MKPRLFIKQESQRTLFKVRGNPFRYVSIRNADIARHGAANAIRQRAARALQMGSTIPHGIKTQSQTF